VTPFVTDVPSLPRSLPTRLPRVRGLLLACSVLLAFIPAAGQAAENLRLKSNIVLVVDQETGEAVVSKNADVTTPIASLTKLMTAMVVLDGKMPMTEILEITNDDVDREKHTTSRVPVGTRLARSDMMLLALMSSENRAAMALSRNYPGGRKAFVAAMNAKARTLGMSSTRFSDPSGISTSNVSTARDLLRLVSAADTQAIIRNYSTQPEATMLIRKQRMKFVNTNRLVRNSREWDIELQKTGFTNEAGRCLVMRATTLNRKLSMVFLNSTGTLTRFADAARVRQHLAREKKSGGARRTSTKVAANTEATS
jgi:serine-type D-Ala-D-Ala endopeptidase (penicillin-binding protein 7)